MNLACGGDFSHSLQGHSLPVTRWKVGKPERGPGGFSGEPPAQRPSLRQRYTLAVLGKAGVPGSKELSLGKKLYFPHLAIRMALPAARCSF